MIPSEEMAESMAAIAAVALFVVPESAVGVVAPISPIAAKVAPAVSVPTEKLLALWNSIPPPLISLRAEMPYFEVAALISVRAVARVVFGASATLIVAEPACMVRFSVVLVEA